MSEINELIANEISDFFAVFGGPGEPDIQSGEAQRLLTERLLSVLALRERAEPVTVLDIQSGRQDGNKFALVFTHAAHALQDDIYNLYTAQPAPPAPGCESFEDFWSTFKHPFAEDDELKSFALEIWHAAMLQGAEPVSPANRLTFDQWLEQQKGQEVVSECGRVSTETFFHWLRVAYEAGSTQGLSLPREV